jgi:hypothetical protein
MAERHFTPEQANALLEEVRPLAERMVEQRRAYVEAAALHSRLVSHIAGNGGDLDPGEVRENAERMEQAAEAVQEAVAQLQGLGVLVKDLDEGLVDFSALRGDEEVLLCWQVGEPEVAYWHGLEEGFAGRKPLEPG